MGDSHVLLIGGPPGAGKTTLGRALAAATGMTSVTGDVLVTAIRAVTGPESHPAFFAALEGHTRYFTDSAPESLVTDAEELEAAMGPVVERVVRSHLMKGDSMVLDWWLLSPQHVAELGHRAVKSVWLWIDPDVLEDRERLNTEFLEGSTDPDRMLANFMHRSLWRNDHVRAEAERLGLPVIEQRGGASVEELVARSLEAVGWLPT